MSSHARHVAPLGASRKRKDREPSDTPRTQLTAKAEPPGPAAAARAAPAKDNRLLAGLLAHEFLTQGTLLGRRWEPGRPQPERGPDPGRAPGGVEPGSAKPGRPAYAEVSYLLKSDGAHIPGVVNPTQLARWLQM